MFEILKRKAIAKEIISQLNIKGSRTMQVNEFGKMLELAKLEDAQHGQLMVSDALRQHDWVNTAVHILSKNVARTDFKLMSGETEVEQGPVYDLFSKVNPYMSDYQLWEATESWLQISGEALWWFPNLTETSIGGLPSEIWVVDPTKFKEYIDKAKRQITLWKYFDDDHPQGIPFKPYSLLHFRKWNKWNQWRGVNPLIAHQENIEQDVQAARENTSLIKNKAIPAGILSTEQILTEDQAKELVERWEKKHKGASKAYKIAVLGRGAKYEKVGMTPDEMKYLDMKKWNRLSILARYGIPPILTGVKDDMTPLSGSDTAEQLKSFWNLTMLPELEFLTDKLNSEFMPRFKLTLEAKFDTSNIPELQDDLKELEDRLRSDVKDGLRTINEARELLDLEPVPWGDTWHLPINLVPVTGEQEPQQPPQEPPPPPRSAEVDTKQYMPIWITRYLMQTRREWSTIEERYRSDLSKWLYEARDYYLKRYGKDGSVPVPSLKATYEDFLFWAEATEKLKRFSETHFFRAVEQTGRDIVVLYRQTGFNAEFDVFQTDVRSIVNNRIDNMSGISQTINKRMGRLINQGTEEGWNKEQLADAIRDKFKDASKRANTIANTELGHIKSEVQREAYQAEGVREIEWIHNPAMSQEPRETHAAMNGERTNFGGVFSNGLRYPRDPFGPPEEVINCNCEYIPVPVGG